MVYEARGHPPEFELRCATASHEALLTFWTSMAGVTCGRGRQPAARLCTTSEQIKRRCSSASRILVDEPALRSCREIGVATCLACVPYDVDTGLR